MPVPEGQITSSQLWSTPEVIEEPEEEVAEEKPKTRKKKVEVNEEILSNKI
jgi:hypothetical protein